MGKQAPEGFDVGEIDVLLATRGHGEPAGFIIELVKPKAAIPMHYGANPLARGTAAEFIKAMEGSTTRVIVPKPGEVVRF